MAYLTCKSFSVVALIQAEVLHSGAFNPVVKDNLNIISEMKYYPATLLGKSPKL